MQQLDSAFPISLPTPHALQPAVANGTSRMQRISYLSALLWASVAFAAAHAQAPLGAVVDERTPLCSLRPLSYSTAKQIYPEAAFALAQLEQQSIATWYSDRNGDYAATAQQLVAVCPESSRLNIVVYGIPNKDCEAGLSSERSVVAGTDDYRQFLQTLANTVGNRKTLYVVEPDAIGLLAKSGGCGARAGYREHLLLAIELLSTNPNADIYLDVGHWTLQYAESAARVAQLVQELAAVGRVKGITLNTSNYRSNAEMSSLCSAFQHIIGTDAMHCIVDTSRNFVTPTSTEWCNTKTAGIGNPPTSNTGFANLDHFMWIKPPGESDGRCNTGAHTVDALAGPDAGAFFADSFKLLWNQGYFVQRLGMPAIDGTVRPILAPAMPLPSPVPVPVSRVDDEPVSLAPVAVPTTTLSPTLTPSVAAQVALVAETAAGLNADSPAAGGSTDIVEPMAGAARIAPPPDTPCPPNAVRAGPGAQQPDDRLTHVDAALLALIRQRHSAAAATTTVTTTAPRDSQLSVELQHQMDQIALRATELLSLSDANNNVRSAVVGVLPSTVDFPVAEVPESVFMGTKEDQSISSGNSSRSGSCSGSRASSESEITATAVALVPSGNVASQGNDKSVGTLSTSTDTGSSSLPTDSHASTATGSSTNRTEVLATLAVVAVIGTLAIVVAVVGHHRRQQALLEAKLSTPDAAIIHVTPSGPSIV